MKFPENYTATCYRIINDHPEFIDLTYSKKMLIKRVLLSKSHLSTKFPDVNVGFYLRRRSNFIHMGLDVPLYSFKNYPDFVKEIHTFLEKDLDSRRFQLVEPQFVLTVKWKYNYIILRKKKNNESK